MIKKIDKKIIFRWIGSIISFPIAFFYLFNRGKFTFIDYLNLLIHEGGHGIFMVFGRFVYFLGGSLMQLIIPGMFVVYYMLKKKVIASQFFLLWLGENFLNISVYASDARTQKLPLIGGKKVIHDWNWILSRAGLLDYDSLIGNMFYFVGAAVFLAALLLPLILSEDNERNIDLKLD